MRRIFALLLGIILLFSFNTNVAAQQRPTITPLMGGFTFPNQIVEEHPVAFRANSTDCAINFTRYYKYYSFKANFDMVFAFDLIAQSSDFRFVVWKLPKGRAAESIFDNNTTIRPHRTVENANLIKGMAETEAEICEGYSTPNNNGYVKAFAQDEALLKDETVVIAVYGNRVTDPFDIKINVAEERELNVFNNRCDNEGYTANEILSALVNATASTNITLYRDSTFQQVIPTSENITTAQTIYAQVRDANGKLIYIYSIPLSFRPNYTFQFNPVNYQVCNFEFLVDFEDLIRKGVVHNGNSADFEVNWVFVEGSRYEDGQIVYLGLNSSEATVEVTYIGTDLCPTTSTFNFTINNVNFIPPASPRISTCSDTYGIDINEFKRLLQLSNEYDLKLYSSTGVEIQNGTYINITDGINTIQYEAIHITTQCRSTRGTIEIEKLSTLPIVDVSLNTCLEDFSTELVQQKILELKNGTNANLNYYHLGQFIQEEELPTIMLMYRHGNIEARVADGCGGSKTIRYSITQSSLNPIEEVYIHSEVCQDINTVINYTQNQLIGIALQNIENAGATSQYNFRFMDEEGNEITSIENLKEERVITVIVKKGNEECSTRFQLKLNRFNQPVVPEASRELTATCDNTITFTAALLEELFGADIHRYQTSVELNRAYALNFNGNNQVVFSISFYEDVNCQVTREIIINKGSDLNVDLTTLQQEILAHPYRFCGEVNRIDIENYLESYINQILTLYPNLRLSESIATYANQMIANNGNVMIELSDPLQCGTKEVRFTYQPYPMPTLDLDPVVTVCTDQLYVLELNGYASVRIINQNGEEVFGSGNRFALSVGTYTVEVTNEFGCSTIKTIQVVTAPLPVIQEIILNLDSIEVIAQSNGGTLEYSIDGRNWQTSNKFTGIQKGISYTIYVRENGCTTVTIPDVVYLNLPNFISPNGDGINDLWRPIGANTSLDVRIKIFNRYGKVVYEAEGGNALNWDGKNYGKLLPSDTYWYFIEYIDNKAVIKLKYQGYITIKSQF